MTKSNVDELMDSGFCQSVAEVLDEKIKVMPKVVDYRDLRTRRGGKYKFVDVTLLFDAEISLVEAHGISHSLEIELRSHFTYLDMVIHLEPLGYQEKQIIANES